MDKRTVAAFILIGLVFLVWTMFFTPKPPEQQNIAGDTNSTQQTQTPGTTDTTPTDSGNTGQPASGQDTVPVANDLYAGYKSGTERYLTIETPLYIAKLNTKGGLLARFTLKNYNSWYREPAQLINDSAGFPGELGLTFKTANGEEINTRDFYFELPEGTITVGEGDSAVVTARLVSPTHTASEASDSTTPTTATLPAIEKQFVFRSNDYDLGLQITAPGINEYSINWKGGLHYQEHNSVDESSKAQAYTMVNDELQEFNAELDEPGNSATYNGSVKWVGTKIKYFAAALVPAQPLTTEAKVSGTAVPADSNGLVESYDFSLRVPTGGGATQNFTLFIGPLEYDLATEHDLTGMVDYGFLEFMVRPIAEYLLLPIFRFIHGFIANWGVVIILFSLLIRGALWPLSIPQIKSSEKMRLIQPVITDMREKYKSDPQKMQMETMKVYREYGVNPVGGCLPLLLQMPILYALWTTLSNAIDLRQAEFAFWITDLSIPDTLIHLPFELPLLGSQISGLALIMGVTLFIQQKLMITDPKQKMIVYIMPIFLFIAFNYFPSGLNLYYFIYNLLSIGQHYYMRNMSKSTLTLEQLKTQAKNKKKGWLSQKLEEAQKMAELQGKTPPKSGGRR